MKIIRGANVWLEVENCFVFTSDGTTKHVQDVLINSNVAGSVVLETSIVGKIQGIQFRGITNSHLVRFEVADNSFVESNPHAA